MTMLRIAGAIVRAYDLHAGARHRPVRCPESGPRPPGVAPGGRRRRPEPTHLDRTSATTTLSDEPEASTFHTSRTYRTWAESIQRGAAARKPCPWTSLQRAPETSISHRSACVTSSSYSRSVKVGFETASVRESGDQRKS